jgi:hypothetical protein
LTQSSLLFQADNNKQKSWIRLDVDKRDGNKQTSSCLFSRDTQCFQWMYLFCIQRENRHTKFRVNLLLLLFEIKILELKCRGISERKLPMFKV